MTALWTSQEIAAATGGTASAGFAATGVSIDSRSIEPGDLFVALAGERDGHEFVAKAMAAGAAGVLASRPVEAPATQPDNPAFAMAKSPRRRHGPAVYGLVTVMHAALIWVVQGELRSPPAEMTEP